MAAYIDLARLRLIEAWNVSNPCQVQFVSYNAIETLPNIVDFRLYISRTL
jgi:hypothetical protein